MMNEDRGIYTIGPVSRMINEHPETIRVWERNGIIEPDRAGYQRKYSKNDIKRLKYIKHLLNDKRLNIAGAKQVISMYPCWNIKNCKGGAAKNSKISINESKPCWKILGTFCITVNDKSELCSKCEMIEKCKSCEKIL